MILLLFIPFLGGLVAWVSGSVGVRWPRRIALGGLIIDSLVVGAFWCGYGAETAGGRGLAELDVPWLPRLGVHFHLGLDGISLLLSALTVFLGIIAVAASWKEITERAGFFYLNLTWTLGGVLGVFLSRDLLLFYFFWELMLVPMYFLIALWGHENRFYGAVKFFIFTQLSGLLMLAAILGLYFLHLQATGIPSFSFEPPFAPALGPSLSLLLLLGFLAAFLVKLPAVPFHTWLPDAHTQAPTAGSIILAGLLLKTGAYGVLRFAIPLFPSAAADVALPIGVLAVIGILYGASLAFAQSDLKRLVAYTSVSHMGFVLLGLFAGTDLAFSGVMIQIVSHGLATGALFVVAGILQDRLGTREISAMGGLWEASPRLAGASLFFALASLGLPGLGTFAGEFLIVLGTFQVHRGLAVAACFGFIVSTIYSLWMVHRVFFGGNVRRWTIADLSLREMAIMVLLIVPLLWLGLYPQTFIDKVREGAKDMKNFYLGADKDG